MRISTSFSDEEIGFLVGLVQCLLRRGDPSILLRSKVFASIFKKIMAMEARINVSTINASETVSKPQAPEVEIVMVEAAGDEDLSRSHNGIPT